MNNKTLSIAFAAFSFLIAVPLFTLFIETRFTKIKSPKIRKFLFNQHSCISAPEPDKWLYINCIYNYECDKCKCWNCSKYGEKYWDEREKQIKLDKGETEK